MRWCCFGMAGNFFLNGFSFLAVIWALTRIRYPEEKPSRHQSIWQSLRSGFAYLRSERQMFVLVWLTAAASLFGIPFLTFIPYFAKVQLNAGASGLGWLLAGSGLGAVLGALTVAVAGRDSASWHRAHLCRRGLLRGDYLLLLLAHASRCRSAWLSSRAIAGS